MRVGLRVFEGKNLGVQSAAEILSANVGCCCACEVPKSEPTSVKVDNKPIKCYGCFCDSYCVADGPMYILVSIKEKLHNQSQTGKIRINHEEGLRYFQQQINVWYISLSGIADIFRGWKILECLYGQHDGEWIFNIRISSTECGSVPIIRKGNKLEGKIATVDIAGLVGFSCRHLSDVGVHSRGRPQVRKVGNLPDRSSSCPQARVNRGHGQGLPEDTDEGRTEVSKCFPSTVLDQSGGVSSWKIPTWRTFLCQTARLDNISHW